MAAANRYNLFVGFILLLFFYKAVAVLGCAFSWLQHVNDLFILILEKTHFISLGLSQFYANCCIYEGFRTLSQDVEEGICQVLAHMWLESELSSASGSNVVSSSSSSASYTSKKGKRPPFERKLGEFFKHQIESDISPVYGDGFRAGQKAVRKYGLQRTLHHIKMAGSFPF